MSTTGRPLLIQMLNIGQFRMDMRAEESPFMVYAAKLIFAGEGTDVQINVNSAPI